MVIKSVGSLSLILGILLPTGASLAIMASQGNNPVNVPMQISLNFPPAPDGDGPESTAGGGTRLHFPPAPDGDGPVSTAGGGTRGGETLSVSECGLGNTKMTALVPSQKTLTVSARPTFFVYVPESKVKTGEFVLINKEGKDVYKTVVQLPLKPSILQIQLPENVTLETGSQYKWSFSITCENDGQEFVDTLEVSIQRNELNPIFKNEIEKAQSPLKKAELYARENLWQDTLMIMAQMRNTEPELWKELLTSIKINQQIAEAPFAPKATVSNSEHQSTP
ncbi:DUF928 domain-containing protein [Planktothrix agardhii 1029]|uniref:DUF928 domain-containing protein n=1 Tax=Planktothrix agardhii TaxID=1160 RepID=UPI001A2B3382|nr:DUF928 domain-containing protein [Planktothrix agardhii]MBG0746103.1 DUF928 domain-containing protein [Planktothrix agardhii KL2]MCF3590189.1 DUF928 domain-containing protein [Planktothrix agardhii 1029]MCF3620345.1 DUF928 domain-containing protein [Planktothrix agardhii 1030]